MLLPPQTWDHCFDVKQIEWTVPEQEMCQRHQGNVGLTPGQMTITHVIVFSPPSCTLFVKPWCF
jgi:hypothetical protein